MLSSSTSTHVSAAPTKDWPWEESGEESRIPQYARQLVVFQVDKNIEDGGTHMLLHLLLDHLRLMIPTEASPDVVHDTGVRLNLRNGYRAFVNGTCPFGS